VESDTAFWARIQTGDKVGRDRSLNPVNRIGASRRWWLLAGLGLATTLGFVCLLVLVPAGVRALPGRYAARLPDFLQELRQRPHPDILPTPAISVTPFLLPAPTPTIPHLSGVTFVSPTPVGSIGTEGQGSAGSPTPRATIEPSKPAVSPVSTRTPIPTNTPTSTPTDTLTPLPQLQVRASLPPITHTYQTWNNCGPATLAMALHYFSQSGTQADAAAFLKPDPEDKNVSPYEMAAYVRSMGLEATVRVGGDTTRLKRLIAHGFPVVVETWFIPEPGDQMGHYRLLTGYDDDARQFIAQDSYNGPNIGLDYDGFDELWRVFNRVYLVLYRPSEADQLATVLGTDVDDQSMYVRALETAQAEVANPGTQCVAYEDCADGKAFAWFNVGSSLNSLGRYEEAAAAYDQARLLGLPWRMLWYQFGPYESYYAVGRYDDVITLATVTLNIVGNLEESYYWRGLAYLARENVDRARSDFEAALQYNPSFAPASEVLSSLE
jgi:tetratricopeptide (TPR) repeat protein